MTSTTDQVAYKAIYKAGHPHQFCKAAGISSTSTELLTAALKAKGVTLADVEIVPVEDETESA